MPCIWRICFALSDWASLYSHRCLLFITALTPLMTSSATRWHAHSTSLAWRIQTSPVGMDSYAPRRTGPDTHATNNDSRRANDWLAHIMGSPGNTPRDASAVRSGRVARSGRDAHQFCCVGRKSSSFIATRGCRVMENAMTSAISSGSICSILPLRLLTASRTAGSVME